MPTLFSDGYFLIFLIHYKISENLQFFCFFSVFLGDLEGVVTPATFKPPALLELIKSVKFCFFSKIGNRHFCLWNPFLNRGRDLEHFSRKLKF